MDMEESGKDPVWILESPEIGYVLNDRCTSYSTAIKWPRITLSHDLHAKLYPHQRIGVRWLASLHHRAEKFGVGGGLLGDDMVSLPGYCCYTCESEEIDPFSNIIFNSLSGLGENHANISIYWWFIPLSDHSECACGLSPFNCPELEKRGRQGVYLVWIVIHRLRHGH
jgi:hypothetical protein